MMADRPILFSASMVRALLDGRKTQTRRILKLPTKTFSGGPIYERPDMGGWEPTTHGGGGTFSIVRGERVPVPEMVGIWHQTTGVCAAAPSQVGDRLWVRERTYGDRMANVFTGERTTNAVVGYYFADDAEVLDPLGFNLSWLWEKRSLPSIHMPRVFSRLTLIVEAVRVEQLRNISDADSLAEGVGPLCHPLGRPDLTWVGSPDVCAAPSYAFKKLWESINGTGSWEANPWVAAITFRVVRANIDALTDDGRPIREAAQ